MANSIGIFIKQTVEELNDSMPEGWELDKTIEFEITFTTTETAEGKMDIKILSLGSNAKGEAIQKMNFSITHKTKAETEEKSQYEVISKGMTAIFKPLLELDKAANLIQQNVKESS